VQIDEPVPAEVMEAIRLLPHVRQVKPLAF
jgi:hypothetical protein